MEPSRRIGGGDSEVWRAAAVPSDSPASGIEPVLPRSATREGDLFLKVDGAGPAGAVQGADTAPQLDVAALWAALRQAPTSRAEDLAAVLASAGFRGQDEGRTWVHGAWRVRLEARPLHDLDATVVTLQGPRSGALPGLFEQQRAQIGKAQLELPHFEAMAQEFGRVQAQFRRALAAVGGAAENVPVEIEAFKDFLETGLPPAEAERAARQSAEQKAARKRISQLLAQLQEQGRAPTRALVYLEGADGVGKTSTSKHLIKALEKAGFEVQTFAHRAPTAEEVAHGEFWRFRQHLPTEDGVATVHDRGPLGGPTYSTYDEARLRAFDEGLQAYDRDLAATPGLFAFKLFIRSSQEAQAATQGKRLGRIWAVDQLRELLRAQGKLTPAIEEQLRAVDDKFDVGDLEDLEEYQLRQERFDRSLAVPTALPWCDVDSSDRHTSRMAALASFHRQLVDWAARSTA